MKEVFDFLGELEKNNNREWFAENRGLFESAKEKIEHLCANLIMTVGSFDESIVGLQPKQCIYRINRDVRFSSDKSPYKTSLGMSMAEGGRSSGNPVYYVHLEPGKSMLACGLYMPPADQLKKIRQEIDYNPESLKKIIEEKEFVNSFGPIRGESLKTAPKGFPKDHPNIELLRFKSYVVWKEYEDNFFFQDHLVDEITRRFEVGFPFNEYLATAIS